MKNKIDLNKVLNSKVLFFLPFLLCLAFFSSSFNNNYQLFMRGGYEVLYSEVIICSLIYFVFLVIIHLLLFKKLDKKNLFFLEVALFVLTFDIFVWFIKVVIIAFCILGILLKNEVKNFILFLASYVILCLFVVNFIPATYRTLMFQLKTKSSDISKEIVVEKREDGPNIYWIHCDGMVSLSTASKYFSVDGKYLKDYFVTNDYYSNDDATLVASHHTMQSLVAMFNPYYYDEFFSEYLNTIEETYYEEDAKVSYYVDYNDLLDRRLNNELFNGLNKVGYEFAAITEFNRYSGFYADYIYDYYNVDGSDELRFIDGSKNTIDMIDRYLAFEHFYTVGSKTVFDNLLRGNNLLNYELLNYKKYDYSNYKYIESTQYWKSKAIVRSLEHLKDNSNNKRFVFIDYTINHFPWNYNIDGSLATDVNNKEALLSTYTHSMYLLTDLLDYIRNNDSNGVIIVQGDHGIHFIKGVLFQEMDEFFGVSLDEMRILRNSTINAVYIPDKYRNGNEEVLGNPLNISRYLINSYVGNNYEYIE